MVPLSQLAHNVRRPQQHTYEGLGAVAQGTPHEAPASSLAPGTSDPLQRHKLARVRRHIYQAFLRRRMDYSTYCANIQILKDLQ